jgi:tetratricopeptide (TPR) repeat protein
MFVATSFVVARRLAFGHLLIVAGLVALALAANRNVLLLYWLATPIAVIAVAPSLRRVRVAIARGRGGPRVARWSGRFALAGGLALAAVAAAREPGLAEAAPFRVPAAGADAIAARGGAGTIFAADQYGGYLIWRLGPAFKPFMDTRLVLRTADEYAEYLQLADRPETFDAWEAEHRMDYVLLPVGYPERYLGLVAHLYESERWRLISTDGTEVLFARAELGDESAPIDLGARDVVDGLAAALDRRFDAPAIREAARLQLAALELAVGQPVEAERALAGLAGAAADRVRARCRLAAGDLDGASTLAGRTLASAPDDVGGLGLLAVIEARRGDTTKAVALLRRALEIDPFDAEAGRILAAWEDDHAQSP